jgi:hypothetical protein
VTENEDACQAHAGCHAQVEAAAMSVQVERNAAVTEMDANNTSVRIA